MYDRSRLARLFIDQHQARCMFPREQSLCVDSGPRNVCDGHGGSKVTIQGHLGLHYRRFIIRFSKKVHFVEVTEFGEFAVGHFSVVVATASMDNQIWCAELPDLNIK